MMILLEGSQMTLTKSEIKANRQLWYDELMSGNHEQTKYVLHDSKGKCCLGVACIVAEREGITERTDDDPGNLGNGIYYGHKFNVLPDEVYQWLGFSEKDERPSDPRTTEMSAPFGEPRMSFSELNDQRGASFEEIAAILKRDFIDPLEEENVDS